MGVYLSSGGARATSQSISDTEYNTSSAERGRLNCNTKIRHRFSIKWQHTRNRSSVLTYTSLVQQPERPASERGEPHAEHGADVAVDGGRDYPFL